MSKPDWKDAPEWAEYLAADTATDLSRPEYWVWFEHCPTWCDGGWLCGERNTRWEQTRSIVPIGFDTEHSLERRP